MTKMTILLKDLLSLVLLS